MIDVQDNESNLFDAKQGKGRSRKEKGKCSLEF
jgi:hypothetical protein